ncbi:PQQ-binding-like beta-propeller repeat protein [Pseudorhodoferax sp. LjRoot39]|uniref:outer membrane protein assembly factor BamB family protein n=1 Tax=Pseudorhodoferax sp. LjRoot39 TaxID=3342328 RepID=UPI003ECE4E3C
MNDTRAKAAHALRLSVAGAAVLALLAACGGDDKKETRLTADEVVPAGIQKQADHWLFQRTWGEDDEPGHWFAGWTKPKKYLGKEKAEPTQPDDCCSATGADSPMVGGNYGQQSYSSLARITPANLNLVRGAWVNNVEGGATNQSQQSTVVAENGVLYVKTSQGNVHAVNGKTGAKIWTFTSGDGNALQRGVAIGPKHIYATGAGKNVYAIDKANGNLVWKKTIVDAGVSGLKTAVIYYNGFIHFGTTDGALGSAYALNAETGDVAWKFAGVAQEGDDAKTWEGESGLQGGASPWMHPAVDPGANLVYYTFGNARQGGAMSATNGSARGGSNLYANSIVAIDATTGKRKWHFQSIHHDIWDLDNVHAPVLADITVAGKLRKAVFYGSKGGLLFVLDRLTGEPIIGVEEQPVPQEARQKTWPTQPIPKGDPFSIMCVNPEAENLAHRPVPNYDYGCVYTPFWDTPVTSAPGTGGAADWNAYSFNRDTGLLYIGAGNINSGFTNTGFFRPAGEVRNGRIVAMDPRTNRIAWERDMPWSLAHGNGILSTKGGVMFIGQPDGNLLGLDVKTGAELWRFQTGAGVHTTPITYEIDGEQYVAVFAGGNGLPYNSPQGDFLWSFKINGAITTQAATPTAPPVRQPITTAAVSGDAVGTVVTLGRTWTNNAPSPTEVVTGDASFAPRVLSIRAGQTVTFTNPSANASNHCATTFYDGGLDTGVLRPGQSATHTFTTPGEYFFNDCVYPRQTGKIIVQ